MADPDHLDVLASTALALAGEFELDAVLEIVVAAAARLTGASYAALGVLGDDDAIERFVTHGMDDETVRRIGDYPTGKGILGVLIRDPEVLRLGDLGAHPASVGFPAHHPPMTTFLGAPVRSGGRVYGNLYLTEKPGGFDEQDERLVVVLAAQAGAAVENAVLSERLRVTAVAEERDRISQELHDGVIQRLFSVGMGLEAARGLAERDPAKSAERIGDAIVAVDDTIRALRNHIFRLRPQDAASMGFHRGLLELAREHEVNALQRPVLDLAPDLDAVVPGSMIGGVLEVVREALTNVARHARASSVSIAASVHGDRLRVSVTDDGAGFADGDAAVGHGLASVRERAVAMDGEVHVESEPGSGTTLTLDVPLPSEAQEAS